LKPWQYHGSVYGVVASERGYQRPVGEWNFEEVVVRGSHVTVTLNGVVIVDADIAGLPSQLGDKHTGRDRKDGFFGFCGHGDAVEFKDVRIKRLEGGGAAAAAEDPPTVRALKLDPGQAGLDSPSNVQVFADPAALTTGLEGQIRFKLTGGETTPEERRAFATKIATQLGSQVDFAKERIAWVAWSTGGPPDGKLLHETKGKDLVFFVQAPAETARGKRLYRANDFFAVPVNTKVTLEKGERPAK
jgi:hypothetical protein